LLLQMMMIWAVTLLCFLYCCSNTSSLYYRDSS
jgi:hypothetical protein